MGFFKKLRQSVYLKKSETRPINESSGRWYAALSPTNKVIVDNARKTEAAASVEPRRGSNLPNHYTNRNGKTVYKKTRNRNTGTTSIRPQARPQAAIKADYDTAFAALNSNPQLAKEYNTLGLGRGAPTSGLTPAGYFILTTAAMGGAAALGGSSAAAGSGASAASGAGATGGAVGTTGATALPAGGMVGTGALSAADASLMGVGSTALPAGGMVGTGALSAADASLMGVGSTALPAASSGGGGLFSTAANAFNTGGIGNQLVGTGAKLLGGVIQGNAAQDAAQTSASAQIEAARIAADAAKFRPVGVASRFGASKFGYDAQGNLTSAGYQMSPELKAQQDALMGISNQALTQYQGAQAATAPLGQGAQTLFGLGQGYLSTSPQEQAAKYMQEQQALLAPSREREMAALQARLQAQGRGGLAIGGTSSGMMAANPELEAYYNAIRQQDLGLAAKATQGGQQYAAFGAGLLGTGSDLQKAMYGTQTAAYAPYQTALGGAATLESLAQNPMDIGTAIGAKSSTASANAGLLTAQGLANAAQTMQPANAYSPWGTLLSGAGQAIGNYNQPQQPTYDPNKFRLVPFGS